MRSWTSWSGLKCMAILQQLRRRETCRGIARPWRAVKSEQSFAELDLLLRDQGEVEAVWTIAVVDLEQDIVDALLQLDLHAVLLGHGGTMGATGVDKLLIEPQLAAVV